MVDMLTFRVLNLSSIVRVSLQDAFGCRDPGFVYKFFTLYFIPGTVEDARKRSEPSLKSRKLTVFFALLIEEREKQINLQSEQRRKKTLHRDTKCLRKKKGDESEQTSCIHKKTVA